MMAISPGHSRVVRFLVRRSRRARPVTPARASGLLRCNLGNFRNGAIALSILPDRPEPRSHTRHHRAHEPGPRPPVSAWSLTWGYRLPWLAPPPRPPAGLPRGGGRTPTPPGPGPRPPVSAWSLTWGYRLPWLAPPPRRPAVLRRARGRTQSPPGRPASGKALSPVPPHPAGSPRCGGRSPPAPSPPP